MSRHEKLFMQLTQSISKAINPVETPVKQKHVRSTIIGTFHEKGAVTFWVVALRLPLQENRIVAWKFCHVLHIILREGHYNCLEQSQRHIGMIEDLGKLWVHLKEGYGKLIQLYATLMITKINFHQRNHRFPGNLQLTAEELDAIGENDINNYFQMSVEIFDYMDDILTLQAAIFDSIDSRTSSMTSSGQCRLAPILPCVQDSNQLYDFSVKLLFKLHSMLPPDTLSGHRERFLKQFKLLKKFYQKTHVMQYFKNLINVPTLPTNPPNFLIQSELRTYVPPVVILPPEEHFSEEQDLVGNLIDTSDTQLISPDTPSDFVDYAQSSQPSDPIVERDNLIEHLHSEISRLRSEIHSMIADHRSTMVSVNERIVSLESQLNAAKDDLEHEKRQRSILMDQQKSIPSAPEFEQRILAAEDRAKSFEEKFQKLKSAYTQMREEHIVLIRQKAECDKQVASHKKTATEIEGSLATLQAAHQLLQTENSKVNSVHVQSANDAKAEVEILKQELASLTDKYAQEKEEINKTVTNLQNELSEIALSKTLLEKQKELDADTLKQELEIEKESFNKNISQLNQDIQNLCSQKEVLVKEKEVALNQFKEEMNQIILKHKSEKETLNYEVLQAEVKGIDLLEENNLLKKENEVTLSTLREEMNKTILNHNTEKETLNNSLLEVQGNLLKSLEEIDLLKKDKEVLTNTFKEEMNETILRHNEEKDVLNNTLLNNRESHSQLLGKIELLNKENEATVNTLKEEANKAIVEMNNEKEALNCTLLEVQENSFKLLEEIDLIKRDSEAKVNALTEESNNLIAQHKDEKDELTKSLSQFEDNFSKLKNDFEQLQKENESLTSRLSWCNNEKSSLECELQDLLQQKISTEDSLSDLLAKFKDAEIALSREISNASLARWSLMKSSLQSSREIIKGTIHELDNPAISSLQCGLEYFRSLLPVTGETLNTLEKELITYEKDKAPSEEISTEIVKLAHLVGTNVIQGVATSNTSKDIVYGEQMALECRELAITMLSCIDYLMALDEKTMDGSVHKENGITNGGDGQTVEHHTGCVRKLLESVGALAEKVGGQDETRAGDSVEGELADMEKAIEEAAARIEEMLKKSRAADSGVKLEVNEKILDACTSLMAAVRELVKRARMLQGEIVSDGRGSNTAKEFYKRNHQWTEGLISAAKAVAMGAKLLLTSADKVVSSSGGKLEHLMVASQEIAASTAQLVVASRVRAARGSERLGALTLASRAVSSATGAVIATAKACATLVEESEDLDMSGLSWQAGRRLEMESRVRVLELEQGLATERLKLAALRRTHYRLDQSEDADAK